MSMDVEISDTAMTFPELINIIAIISIIIIKMIITIIVITFAFYLCLPEIDMELNSKVHRTLKLLMDLSKLAVGDARILHWADNLYTGAIHC